MSLGESVYLKIRLRVRVRVRFACFIDYWLSNGDERATATLQPLLDPHLCHVVALSHLSDQAMEQIILATLTRWQQLACGMH